MVKAIHRVSTVIKGVADLPGPIRVLDLCDADDWPLPPFTAGAHIDLHLPSGKVRQYSLINDPQETNRYQVAVQHEADGRGGSAEIHGSLQPGDTVLVSLPRNSLPIVPHGRQVMVAGGIGITPFLSMLPVMRRSGLDYRLHICLRSRTRNAFATWLAEHGERVRLHCSDESSRLDIPGLLEGLGPQDQLYVCGPARMIDTVRQEGAFLDERLHYERFGAVGPLDDAAYTIELARSGAQIQVAPGETMLEALRVAGVEVASSCEGGICLECKTRYLAGTPVHRDLAMTAADRETHLTPCVSGCASEKIILDL